MPQPFSAFVGWDSLTEDRSPSARRFIASGISQPLPVTFGGFACSLLVGKRQGQKPLAVGNMLGRCWSTELSQLYEEYNGFCGKVEPSKSLLLLLSMLIGSSSGPREVDLVRFDVLKLGVRSASFLLIFPSFMGFSESVS